MAPRFLKLLLFLHNTRILEFFLMCSYLPRHSYNTQSGFCVFRMALELLCYPLFYKALCQSPGSVRAPEIKCKVLVLQPSFTDALHYICVYTSFFATGQCVVTVCDFLSINNSYVECFRVSYTATIGCTLKSLLQVENPLTYTVSCYKAFSQGETMAFTFH